jgi:PhzF family phenazine biosynthesis protein
MRVCFVDSFTDAVFKGNPAAVCFYTEELTGEERLAIAREIGFSETAFVGPADANGPHPISYFSPVKEIPLCGHATLAAATIIFEGHSLSTVHFLTSHGVLLSIRKEGENIVMQFPVYELEAFLAPVEILQALGLDSIVHAAYSPVNKIVLLEMQGHERLAALRPDFNALLASYAGINGVLVTAASGNDEYDYYYRYFWPWAGTNEDPVTGGVQTFLAKYWVQKLGKTTLNACQCSERGGSMQTVLSNDHVSIYGKAVVWLRGEISI